MTEPSAEVDFLLFKGRRITDVDDDARDEKALVGGGLPSPCASVAELPMDASLLAVCNVRGVLFAGAPGAPALRWGRLAALSAALVPGGADVASLLSEVPLPAAPLVVALSCDGARLVVATEDGAASLALHLYDVAGLLRGAHAPAATHSLALGGALLALQWSPSAPLQMLAADASGGVTLLAWGAAAGAPTAASTADVAGLRSAAYAADGAAVLVGHADGRLSRRALAGDALGAAEEELVGASALDAERAGAALAHVAPIGEGFVLLLHEADENDPLLASVWHVGAAKLDDASEVCMRLMRDDADGNPARRRYWCAAVPQWRTAVVCSSDTDKLDVIGSPKGKGKERWQKWDLPDEAGGNPVVPQWERGDDSEDQYVAGVALDLTNADRVSVVSGEEKFPPSPVVWALTTHGSLLAWTLLHKLVPATDGKYPFMKVLADAPPELAAALPGGAAGSGCAVFIKG